MTKKQARQMLAMYWSITPKEEHVAVRKIVASVFAAMRKHDASWAQKAVACQNAILVAVTDEPAAKKRQRVKK